MESFVTLSPLLENEHICVYTLLMSEARYSCAANSIVVACNLSFDVPKSWNYTLDFSRSRAVIKLNECSIMRSLH